MNRDNLIYKQKTEGGSPNDFRNYRTGKYWSPGHPDHVPVERSQDIP